MKRRISSRRAAGGIKRGRWFREAEGWEEEPVGSHWRFEGIIWLTGSKKSRVWDECKVRGKGFALGWIDWSMGGVRRCIITFVENKKKEDGSSGRCGRLQA